MFFCLPEKIWAFHSFLAKHSKKMRRVNCRRENKSSGLVICHPKACWRKVLKDDAKIQLLKWWTCDSWFLKHIWLQLGDNSAIRGDFVREYFRSVNTHMNVLHLKNLTSWGEGPLHTWSYNSVLATLLVESSYLVRSWLQWRESPKCPSIQL